MSRTDLPTVSAPKLPGAANSLSWTLSLYAQIPEGRVVAVEPELRRL